MKEFRIKVTGGGSQRRPWLVKRGPYTLSSFYTWDDAMEHALWLAVQATDERWENGYGQRYVH